MHRRTVSIDDRACFVDVGHGLWSVQQCTAGFMDDTTCSMDVAHALCTVEPSNEEAMKKQSSYKSCTNDDV